jgi:hypothetical protein
VIYIACPQIHICDCLRADDIIMLNKNNVSIRGKGASQRDNMSDLIGFLNSDEVKSSVLSRLCYLVTIQVGYH